jgi:hypothetical protein
MEASSVPMNRRAEERRTEGEKSPVFNPKIFFVFLRVFVPSW